MEPARDLIARQPPALLFVGGTTNPSASEERVAARFMKPWPRFFQDIMEAIELLDLDGNVKVTSEEERFIVANELGVTSRFIKNICDSVSSALSVTRLRDVFFGDIQSVNVAAPLRIPDVTVSRVTNPQSLQGNALRVVAVGELKTWWTIELEQFPITDPEPSLVHLENHIGQLVSYMKRQKLKHGFLSTYEVTVFARRIDDYRIELSPPVLRTAQCPSLRECFVAFCAMASADPEYIEKDDFNDLILSGASSGFQASMRPASNRIFVTQPEPLQYTIGQGTIFIGDGKNAKTAANFVRFLNGDTKTSKAVMEVEWSGRKCVAKCWRPEKVRSYMSEAYVYDQLANRECE